VWSANNDKITKMKEIIITPQTANQRADKFIRKWLKEAPLSFIYKLFRKKDVKVNGKRISIEYILQAGDQLSVYVHDDQLKDFTIHRRYQKKPLTLPIIYQDAHCLMIHKPKGLLVQGEDDTRQHTLTEMVIEHLYATGEYDPNTPGFTPAPGHRLDRNTSGLVLYGKTMEGLQALHQLFKDREDLAKHYYALVVGRLSGTGTIDFPLVKDEAKKMVFVAQPPDTGLKALTEYEVIKSYGEFTLVKVHLVTGRTHQIRVHFQAIQHPIAGDRKYGDFKANQWLKQNFGYEHQFLQATALSFNNITGPLKGLSNQTFTIKLDAQEEQLLVKLLS
jgi:23S rRNA pseudouridine955/2504/2580 synthase